MRTSKFQVPADVLIEFIDAACEKELQPTILSADEEEYQVEINYEKEESQLIDELEEELENIIESEEE